MHVSAVGSPPIGLAPKAAEATEARGAVDHDGDADDQAASAAKVASTPTGPLQPGFSLYA
jgi:hypothetical protein